MRSKAILTIVAALLVLQLLTTPVHVAGKTILKIKVVDYDGAPVAGAKVLVAARGWGEAENVTDEDGVATIAAEGYEGLKELGVFVYYKAREVGEAVMKPPETSITVNASIYSPVLRIYDGKNRPLEGAIVTLSYETIFETYEFTATTGPMGYAYFNQLPAGGYNVTVLNTWGVLLDTNMTLNEATLNVTLTTNAYNIWVTVLDEAGQPLSGAGVALGRGSLITKTITDYNGRAVFTGVPPGTYSVYASYALRFVEASVTVKSDDVNVTLSFAPTQATTTTTPPPPTQTPTGTPPPPTETQSPTLTPPPGPKGNYTLIVKVQWSNRRRAINAEVEILHIGNMSRAAKGRTDANGQTTFVLKAGTYLVQASLYGAQANTTLLLTGNTTVTLILDVSKAEFPVYKATIRVMWSDGTPIRDAVVIIKDVDLNEVLFEIALNKRNSWEGLEGVYVHEGAAEVHVNLLPGIYLIEVKVPRYQLSVTQPLILIKDEIVSIVPGENPIPQQLPILLLILSGIGIIVTSILIAVRGIIYIERMRGAR